MKSLDLEELNSKCWVCSSGMTPIESFLYQNRCTFCSGEIRKFNILLYMAHIYYDHKIYKQQLRLRGEDDNAKFNGVLGSFGYADINQVDTIKKKKEIIKSLKEMK